MLAYFKQSAEKEGIPEKKIRTACIELKGEQGELDGQKFDVIVVSSFQADNRTLTVADMPLDLVLGCIPSFRIYLRHDTHTHKLS